MVRSKVSTAFLLLFSLLKVYCDVYMHNPRGSNDRNCERNANRDNGNRLFNSQNNNAGGYACPRGVGDGTFQPESGQVTFNSVDTSTGKTTTFVQNKRMYYYENSILPIEWTSQHGCGGNSKVSCEIILQYACEDTLDPQVDNFWPWVQNKAESGTKYYGKQHFRDTASAPQNIAAPRDGVPSNSDDAATDTIPDDEASAIPNTVATRRFGMQESNDYYQVCQRTERNKGLYTADQAVNRNDRRGTRQNPNGDRHGYECPEERDYYPWWAPSPWIDIAVLTDSGDDLPCYPRATSSCTKRCQYYMNNTMNSHKKGYCDVDQSAAGATVTKKLNDQKWQSNQWYNNEAACIRSGYKWYMVSHSDNLNLDPDNNFVCGRTQFSRVNQLGNAAPGTVVSQDAKKVPTSAANWINENPVIEGLNANRFLWTVPSVPKAKDPNYFSAGLSSAYQSCVLRIRYNISSADFQPWPVDAVNGKTTPMVDSRNNSKTKNDPKTPLKQDPYVYIGPGDYEDKGAMFLSLAVNTNQYSRTFQDRSYVFSIKPLPTADIPESTQTDTPPVNYAALQKALAANPQAKIYNVNVRGKRGNIVQVYPSVEYDFVPNQLKLQPNDIIHWQWTGSDYNPRRGCNDAEGGPPDLNTYSTDANANLNPRADRSNVVFTSQMGSNIPQDYQGNSNGAFAERADIARTTTLSDTPCIDPAAAASSPTAASECYASTMRLAYLNQQRDGGSLVLRAGKNCLTQAELEAIPNKDVANFHPLNCAKLNAKPYPYFDGGLMIMRKLGWFSFFSSRNNNFSNRQQSGVVCVGSITDCKLNNYGVLQTDNTVSNNGNSKPARQTSTVCYDAAGRVSDTACVFQGPPITTEETFTPQQADSDAKGDGNLMGCAPKNEQLSFSSANPTRIDQQVGLAIGLLALGVFITWLSYYCYTRYTKARDEKWLNKPRVNSFRGNPPLSGEEDRIPARTIGGISWSSMFGRPSNFKNEKPSMSSIEVPGPTKPPARLSTASPPPPPPPPPPPKRSDVL